MDNNEINNEMNQGEPEKKDKKEEEVSFVKELIKDIIIAVVIVIAITAVIKPTIVKESSMEDTLYENDYLFVYKLAYINKDHPDYGDIIVFKSELIDPDNGKQKLLIKRVIGVEGDVISFEDDQVYRNGEKLDEKYIMDEVPEYRSYPNGQEFTVGDDEVFAMGDHRSVSLDSRSAEVGNVDEDTIVGKAVIRIYPFSKFGLLDDK